MQTYYFKSKHSKEKFSSRINTDTREEAIEYFAEVKQLPIKEFEKLYEVKEDDK